MACAYHLAMQTHEFPRQLKDKVLVIRPAGYLNEELCLKLKKELLQDLKKGTSLFVLDLEKVTVINSSGITQLLEIAEEVILNHKGKLGFSGVSQLYLEVFQVIGLTGIADIYSSEQEAVEDLRD